MLYSWERATLSIVINSLYDDLGVNINNWNEGETKCHRASRTNAYYISENEEELKENNKKLDYCTRAAF